MSTKKKQFYREKYEFCQHCWTKLDTIVFSLSGLLLEEEARQNREILHVYHSLFRKCPRWAK